MKRLGVLGGGWGQYCSNLERHERHLLNQREKVKLDVEFAKLKQQSKDGRVSLLKCGMVCGCRRIQNYCPFVVFFSCEVVFSQVPFSSLTFLVLLQPI